MKKTVGVEKVARTLMPYLESLCAARAQAERQIKRYQGGEHYDLWLVVMDEIVQQITRTEKDISALLGHKVKRINR